MVLSNGLGQSQWAQLVRGHLLRASDNLVRGHGLQRHLAILANCCDPTGAFLQTLFGSTQSEPSRVGTAAGTKFTGGLEILLREEDQEAGSGFQAQFE